MVSIVRTAGNFEVLALASHATVFASEVVDSQEPGENLCTSFVCEVSAKKINTILSCKYRFVS